MTASTGRPVAIGLMSGGLDSLLAASIMHRLGFKVIAFQYITPFFGWSHRGNEAKTAAAYRQKLGFEVRVESAWPDYLEVIRRPRHGYGRNLNPCLDCKIFMLRRAAAAMNTEGGAFVFTGEVLGQRPMSQRRDALHIVENESGMKGYLLRPLSAKLLPPTRPEREGIVSRHDLYDLSGRSRKGQLKLAADFGITDFPNPAGGCLLAEPNFCRRAKATLADDPMATPSTFELLAFGRHFRIRSNLRLVIGRHEKENEMIASFAAPGDLLLSAEDVPGPTALLRGPRADSDIVSAAELTAAYADKTGVETCRIRIQDAGGQSRFLTVRPANKSRWESVRL